MYKWFFPLALCLLPIIGYAGNIDNLRLQGSCGYQEVNKTPSEIDYTYTCSLPFTYNDLSTSLISSKSHFAAPSDEIAFELIVTGSWKAVFDANLVKWSIIDIKNNPPQLHVYIPADLKAAPMKQTVSCNQDESKCLIHLQTGVLFTDDQGTSELPATAVLQESLHNLFFPLNDFTGKFFWE